MWIYNDRLYRPREVADLLEVSVSTLTRWRRERRGPPFVRVGNQVRYPGDMLDRYLRGWRAVDPDPDTRNLDL